MYFVGFVIDRFWMGLIPVKIEVTWERSHPEVRKSTKIG